MEGGELAEALRESGEAVAMEVEVSERGEPAEALRECGELLEGEVEPFTVREVVHLSGAGRAGQSMRGVRKKRAPCGHGVHNLVSNHAPGVHKACAGRAQCMSKVRARNVHSVHKYMEQSARNKVWDEGSKAKRIAQGEGTRGRQYKKRKCEDACIMHRGKDVYQHSANMLRSWCQRKKE